MHFATLDTSIKDISQLDSAKQSKSKLIADMVNSIEKTISPLKNQKQIQKSKKKITKVLTVVPTGKR